MPPREQSYEIQSTVFYKLFPAREETNLHVLRDMVLVKARELSDGYLWNEDSFNLIITNNHLSGSVCFGHCMEDEWFVTYLLFNISMSFSNLVIRIWDEDGEFLLIEAAEYLPDWLEPENSENRIFIHKGKLHIIDISHVPAPLNHPNDAVCFVCSNSSKTEASKSIQQCIDDRLRPFLEGPGQFLYRARVILPKKLALILQAQPYLISVLLKALFNRRDTLYLAKASRLCNFKQVDGSLDLVSVRVQFTRHQFAQLLCQQVHPPRGYPMPSESSPDFLACSLGFKVALGAELGGIYKIFDNSLESINDQKVVEYHGPDDDTSWLNVEDGLLLNNLEDKLQRMNLSAADQESIVKEMLQDDDNGKQLSKMDQLLQNFLKSSSEFDGIVPGNPEETDSEYNAEEFSESSEDNADLLEREIIETILHDPDLFMKILDVSADLGIETKELVEKVKTAKLNYENVYDDTNNNDVEKKLVKKGIADIDPNKVAAARTGSRAVGGDESRSGSKDEDDESENENENSAAISDSAESFSSLVDMDEFIYDNNVKYIKNDALIEAESLESSSSDEKLQDYITTMDSELCAIGVDRHYPKRDEDFIKSIGASNSPAHSILLYAIKDP